MRKPESYRYFLAFRPDLVLRCWLASLGEAAGQRGKRVKAEYLHLTLCVVAEGSGRDPFIAARMNAALSRLGLSSCPIRLGRMCGGASGAALYTIGRQAEIQDFFQALLCCLAARGIAPLHRVSGLRPHITLGYDPCEPYSYKLPQEWIPDEIMLIESEVGNGVHRVLGRWTLLPPRQGSFPFDEPPQPVAPVLAAGGRG